MRYIQAPLLVHGAFAASANLSSFHKDYVALLSIMKSRMGAKSDTTNDFANSVMRLIWGG